MCFVGLARERVVSTSLRATKEGSSGSTPVVDDSDSKNEAKETSGKKKTDFDDIMTEADNFATSIERKSRRSTAVARVSLEDELRHLAGFY